MEYLVVAMLIVLVLLLPLTFKIAAHLETIQKQLQALAAIQDSVEAMKREVEFIRSGVLSVSIHQPNRVDY